MESSMGVKDAVIALLQRLPDDCSLDDVIDRLYELGAVADDAAAPKPLTEAQRSELDRRLALLEQGSDPTIPWEEVRRELERDE